MKTDSLVNSIKDIQQFRLFAEEISKEAGKILLDYQDKFTIVKQKDIQDIATTADIASENLIIKAISNKYPKHGIVSEESGLINKEADYIWFIDPLDGTKDYIRGIPQWNCSVALKYKDEIIASCVYRPNEDVIYSAGLGIGSYKNSDVIRVSTTDKLSHAFIYCYLPKINKGDEEEYDNSSLILSNIGKSAYRLRSLSNQNTALCWLAHGGFEAYINLSNVSKLHDIYPGLLIAKEAGAINAVNKMPIVVANNESIYNGLLTLINNYKFQHEFK